MRLKIILILTALSGLILAWNLHTIFLKVPDEASQGAIFRIIYFHVPAVITAFVGFYTAMLLGVGYLIRRDLRLDSIAASINEVSLAFALVTICTGSIWGRVIWGIWWTWDARLTSYFVCMLDVLRVFHAAPRHRRSHHARPPFRGVVDLCRAPRLCWCGSRSNGSARSTRARFSKFGAEAAWPREWKHLCGGTSWPC